MILEMFSTSHDANKISIMLKEMWFYLILMIVSIYTGFYSFNVSISISIGQISVSDFIGYLLYISGSLLRTYVCILYIRTYVYIVCRVMLST